ncbi:retrovirus-related Pol polyprotein from transposon 297 [Trichonephila clavipes]|nr:retrovirus-related Pol polyprotein from transposon 297 [Trichonephila clavipes]
MKLKLELVEEKKKLLDIRERSSERERESKWAEIIPLKNASARVIANKFFDYYTSRFGAPVKLISDNGPQFISDIFEHLSDRLGIRRVKTVVYRPQANRTKRVNRDLVQMIANYISDQHDTLDQFLPVFAYAIRTAMNETTGKTPAELFLGQKSITPFQKFVMVSNGTEFAVGDIQRLFEEARRNTKSKHKKWGKYYNRHRRDVQIKVNEWVLIAMHPSISATKKVADHEVEEKWNPDRPWRGRHDKEDQFESGKAEEGTAAPTSNSKQDQTTGVQDEEVINNGRTRIGKERLLEDPCP